MTLTWRILVIFMYRFLNIISTTEFIYRTKFESSGTSNTPKYRINRMWTFQNVLLIIFFKVLLQFMFLCLQA